MSLPVISQRRRQRPRPQAKLAVSTKRDLASRAFRIQPPPNPPSTLNSGDVWHSRRIGLTSLADSAGTALLTAGQVLTNLSGNAGNIPVRIAKICAYAIAGTSGQYPPTFLQVNFFNEEFMQTQPNNPAARDSIFDAGGQGAGPPCVGLYIPDSQRQTRDDWGTASTTQLAQAISLPSGARVLWHITLQFKF
jgi:hypothetical protein